MEYEPYPSSLHESRMQDAEHEIRKLRRRFRLALAAYIILAVGLVAAFYVSARIVDEAKDDTHALCQTIRQLSDERAPCQ